MEEDKDIAERIKKENAERIEAANYILDKVLSEEEWKIFEDYKYTEEDIRQIRGGRPKELGINQDLYDYAKKHNIKMTLKGITEGNNDLLKWCIHGAYITGFKKAIDLCINNKDK